MADKIYVDIIPNTKAYDLGGDLYSPINPHIDQGIHYRVAWYGKLNPQTATQWATITTLNPYVVTSGNDTWSDPGEEAQLFGTADELVELGTGLVAGSFNWLCTIANSSTTVYKLRLVWGTGTLLASIALGQWSENMYFKSVAGVQIPRHIECPIIPFYDAAGLPMKVWMQCWNATDNATLNFFISAHGYTTV
jgi:hypothetical protein